MEAQELQDRIASFPRWHYRFEFEGGIATPVSHRGQINRHEQRARYFFDPLVRVAGGSLQGRRVLDLGCNAGYWSLRAIEAGADLVVGIDGHQRLIDQANLVFEAKGVASDRYRFECGDIFEHRFQEQFEVVLCLGLMEVTAKPVELFEIMAAVGAELIVLDTGISRRSSAYFELTRIAERANAVGHEIALLPTWQAVVELAQEFGFTAVPLAQSITDYAGLDDYRRGRRVAFIASRGARPEGLTEAKPPGPLPRWLGELDPRALLERARP